jgi:hypothetical protein
LTKDFRIGQITVVSPLRAFRIVPPHTQGGASACRGLICRAPSGLKAAHASVGWSEHIGFRRVASRYTPVTRASAAVVIMGES